MGDPGGIPELQYTHPDGRQKSRLEMEQWLRQEIPKVHWHRIIANKFFGLSKTISWDMKEIVLKHWLLNEMIRRNLIYGDIVEINANASNDDAEMRQFTQRLAALIQSGQAVQPQHAEGVDMNQFTPPPPPPMGSPVPPQTNAAPPGPPGFSPPPVPGGYGPPTTSPAGPPGPAMGYAQQPGPPMTPPMPGPAMAPPMGPPQGFGPPGPPGPPAGGPPMGPPPGVPQQTAPVAAGPGRGRGRKAADAAAPAPAGPPVGGPPQNFAPPPAGGPQGFAPLPAAPVQQSVPFPAAPVQQSAPAPVAQAPVAATVDLSEVNQRIDNLLSVVGQQTALIAALQKQVQLASMVTTVIARAYYQQQGSADAAEFLKGLGVAIPQ